MPHNLGTLKHMRLYGGRLMSGYEIASNAASGCFNAYDINALSWFKFNQPTVQGGSTSIAFDSANETQYSGVYPAHGLTTSYAYNSTNQVMQQRTPDAGISRFWYDNVGRLTASQNARQEPLRQFSYTKFDLFGRITEVGQKGLSSSELTALGTAFSEPSYLDNSQRTTFLGMGSNSELTQTIYDTQPAATGGVPSGFTLNNLRKRVAASIYRETPSSANINASYYDYDYTGNVKTLRQQVDGLGLKRLDYEFDLHSGKVNFLAYQHGANDQFYYQYEYDAENRLIQAATGTTANVISYGFGSGLTEPNKRVDATYAYYPHGPLARVELGEDAYRIQGIDYAYTLQGWLKGVNGNGLDPAKDMGGDGYGASNVARDALSYSLGYYNGDYSAIGGGPALGMVYQQQAGDITGQSLYNGNISNSTYGIMQVASNATTGYTYAYDQLNRLKTSQLHNSISGNWNRGSITAGNYGESFSYDGNGNILSLLRNKQAGVMDQLSYNYNRDAKGKLVNNRLNGVSDAAGVNNGTDVGTTAYSYDAIGNLIKDNAENVTGIDWNVYGKIKQVTKTGGNISYTYDPTGNRVSKTFGGKTTWYVRDAQGNSLAVYSSPLPGEPEGAYWREQQLYGSSRLGMWKPNVNLATQTGSSVWDNAARKNYELSNHLGNVMAVITEDRDLNGGDIQPTLISSQDYYSFGGQVTGRKGGLAYRYGFNGKENDDEVKGEGNQQDYGMRIYDPRIAKFLSVDPITNMYPELTPYQFASNRPIDGVDLDGLEYKNKSYYSLEWKTTANYGVVKSEIVVKYIYKNMPSFFIRNNIMPEKASAQGYDLRSDIVQISDPYRIRPDYSAIGTWAQDSQSEFNSDEPTMQLSNMRGIGNEPSSVPTKPGTAIAVASMARNWLEAALSLTGLNAAKNEAFYDKKTFYQSINLVDNFTTINKLKKITGKVRVDLINYVNDGTVPYNPLDAKSRNGITYKQAIDYNNMIENVGREIFKSGKDKGGYVDITPKNPVAIPYQ